MFSIIIPIYNKSKQISRTLKSVFQQTFKDFEIIIVDDGSTDDSLAVIRDNFNDSRITIVTQANQGVSAARNKGISKAGFDYIAFLDADDLWHPDYLKCNRDIILSHPDIAIFGSDYEWIYPDEEAVIQPVNSVPEAQRVVNYFSRALQHTIFWTSATIIKKTALEQAGGFRETLKVGEDLDVWFRVLLQFEGVHIKEKLAWYMRSSRDQIGPGKLVLLKNHLIGQALDIYADTLAANKTPFFNQFLYNFILSDLIFYYFDAQYHAQAVELYRKIKLKYRFNRPRYVLYLLPYSLSKYLYTRLRKTKG